MAGNGYFAEGVYQAKSTETWADLTGGWDTYTSWNLTPASPLTFTTNVVDFGRIDDINYLAYVDANFPANITVYYGNTISAGAIVSPSQINVTPNQTLSGVKARYFQFTVSVSNDSSGDTAPVILGIKTDLRTGKRVETISNVSSATLTGSTGVRELSVNTTLSKITGAVCQPLISSNTYVASGYVASEDSAGEVYVASSTTLTGKPQIYLDKSTDPITMYIYDFDTYGKTKPVDCSFDAVITGLPGISSDANGSIKEI